MTLKITNLGLQPPLPGANELIADDIFNCILLINKNVAEISSWGSN